MNKLFRSILSLLLFLGIMLGVLYLFRDYPNLKIYTINLFDDDKRYQEDAAFVSSVHYQQLSALEKDVYALFYDHTHNDIYSYEFPSRYSLEIIDRALEAYSNDYPEYYYLSIADFAQYKAVALSLSYTEGSYEDDQYMIKANMKQFQEKAETILDKCADGDEFEQVRNIYDYVLARVSYNADSLYNQDLRSSLLLGESVCSGYAKMLQYLFQQAGYEAYFVSGMVTGQTDLHAWVLMKYRDHYYWFDPTFDDLESVTYDHFFGFDELFLKDHQARDFTYPACDDDSMYMYRSKTIYSREYDHYVLDRIYNRVADGDAEIRLLFADHDAYQDALTAIIDEGVIYDIWRIYNRDHGEHQCRYAYSDEGNYLILYFE